MKRIAWIGAALLVFGTASCKKEEKAATTKKADPKPGDTKDPGKVDPSKQPQPEQPKKLVGAELVKAVNDCFATQMATKDASKLKECWTADAVMKSPGMPDAVGADAIGAHFAMIHGSSPDMSFQPVLQLVSGNTIARVALIKGTNTGPMMAGTPQEQKPTGKPWGLLGLAVDEVDDQGKIKEGRHYMDAAVIMGQLGVIPGMPTRKIPEKVEPLAADPIVGTGAEPALAAVKAAYDASAKGDMKAWSDMLSDDVVVIDQGMPEDIKGKAAFMKMMDGFHKGFPDMKMTPTAQWGAGDYVLTELTMTGKNTGAMPDMGIKKATNKEINVQVAELVKMENGKVTHIWWFGNGLQMMSQLGMLPEEPGKGAEKAPEKAPEKPAQP
jgi:ketosteroid isomerase-like protein